MREGPAPQVDAPDTPSVGAAVTPTPIPQTADTDATVAPQSAPAVVARGPATTLSRRPFGTPMKTSNASSNALLASLPGNKQRETRKQVEALLKREARELDELVVAQRRVLARKDHSAYLTMLHKEIDDIDMWFEQVLLGFLKKKMPAMRIAFAWRFRPWGPEGERALKEAQVEASANLRRQLGDIKAFRHDVRKQAFEFFERVAPPIAKNVKELRKRMQNSPYQQQRVLIGYYCSLSLSWLFTL